MKNILVTSIFVGVLIICSMISVHAQGFYLKGDFITLAGQKYTLNSFVKGQGIWKTKDGKSYIVETAKRQEKENYILTEVQISKDKSTIRNWGSAFKIGSKTPFDVETSNKLQQVALYQKIENERLLKRRVIKSGSDGFPRTISGLIYYQIGDAEKLSGKELILESFKNDQPLWKDNENQSYNISINKKNGSYTYVVKRKKP